MDLQDRAFAVGVFVILGVCCIGAYVAVSGFFNANPSGLSLGQNVSTPSPAATLLIPTGTVEIPTLTQVPTATIVAAPPTKTPKGFKPSPTPVDRGTPSPAFLADIPTVTPSVVSTQVVATAPPPVSGCGFAYCPRPKGPPTTDAPTGNVCPLNYLWGFVLDSGGRGVANVRVHYTNPNGDAGETLTKAPPDPAGRWDVVAGGGTWTIQLLDQNHNPISPPVPVEAHIPYTTGNSCPTRLDFVKQ